MNLLLDPTRNLYLTPYFSCHVQRPSPRRDRLGMRRTSKRMHLAILALAAVSVSGGCPFLSGEQVCPNPACLVFIPFYRAVPITGI